MCPGEGLAMTQKMPSLFTPIGLILILVGGLRAGDPASGALAFAGFLILGVVTYPPSDLRRGAQAALVLGSAICLVVLGLLAEEFLVGPAGERVIDDLLILAGSALVMWDAAAQLVGSRERDAVGSGWSGSARPYPVRPVP